MDNKSHSNWDKEVNDSNRFEFGKNWIDYIAKLSDDRINAARTSMNEFLPPKKLKEQLFIDIGSGSGLHSLAAMLDGAKVTSFDYDPNSVKATSLLKDKFKVDDARWQVSQGSVLDVEFMNSLPKYDIVYSWGVLHHTGSMWQAITNAIGLVKDEGYFLIAIYNKQGWKSKFWWYIKYIYNKLPNFAKKPYAIFLGIFFNAVNILKYTLLLKPQVAIKPLLNYKHERGMNLLNDIIDWMGGFPYEYASVEELETFFIQHNFILEKVKRETSLGCNELLFKKKNSK